MLECKALVAACVLLLCSTHALVSEEFESPDGMVVGVKSQEELASLVAGLNWSNNNTIYVMVPALSQESSTSPINSGTNPQTNDTQDKNLTTEWTETTIALRDGKDRYVRVDNENLYVDSTDINAPERFHPIDRGNNKVSFLAPNGKYVGFSIYTSEGGWVESPYLTALFDETDSSTVFEKTYKGEGRYVFKTYNGCYLKVEDDGRFTPAVVADFSGSYDTFQIEIQDEPIQKAIDDTGPGGTIYLKEGVYRGTVTTNRSVNLIGAGSGTTFVDEDKKGSVLPIGKTNSNIDVTLAHMVIQKGLSENGGGINNFGRLTLEDTIITRNEATGSGGGVSNKEGTMVMNYRGYKGI